MPSLNNGFADLNGISSKVPSLILLDLSNNKISDCTLLADLGALEQFSELMIEGNPCAKTGYREEVKQLLTGLLTLDHDLIELEVSASGIVDIISSSSNQQLGIARVVEIRRIHRRCGCRRGCRNLGKGSSKLSE